MTMNLRRQRPSDSLDMLLDTMCNTFGGIILLAVLVTLLTSRERHGSANTASDNQEMLQRRLKLAEQNLQQSLLLQQTLQTKANNDSWKSQITLLASRRQIKDEINQVRELAAQSAQDLDASASINPADRIKNLNAQLAAAQLRKLEAQNSLAASQATTNQLHIRLASLQLQTTNLVNQSQRKIRLPKEHDTDKQVIYVIARYGRIYPCRNPDMSQNEADISWTEKSTDEIAEPKPGKGIDLASNPGALKAFLGRLSGRSIYLAFLVFEDSFPAFIQARQITAESGVGYGWEPFRLSDGPVTFSLIGHTPKPQ